MIAPGAHILGIDPGKTGGLAVLDAHGKVVSMIPMPMEAGEFDINTIYQIFQSLPEGSRVIMEGVHAFPGQGVNSVWAFAEGVGIVKTLVMISQLPLEFVTPVTWQKSAGGKTGGDKDVTKAWCRRNFPGTDFPMVNKRPKGRPAYQEIHEGVSDALGIAWFGVLKYGAAQ